MGWGRYSLKVVALALAYFLTGRLGLLLSTFTTHITLVWPPTGIAVAALWIWGPKLWPGVLLGALAVNLAVGLPISAIPWVLVGNTLAPLITVFLLRKTEFNSSFLRFGDFLRLFIAALLGMMASATLGVLALYPVGSQSVTPWLTWWAGDFLGVLCFSPLFLAWNWGAWPLLMERRFEFLAWTTTTFLMLSLVFVFNGEDLGASFPIAFVPFPFLAWGAVRFGVIGNGFGLGALTLVAGFSTAIGHGPFGSVNIREGHFILWVFLVIATTMCWSINALVATEARATELQRTLELALSDAKVGVLLADTDSNIIYANRGFLVLTGYAESEILGKNCRFLQGEDSDPKTVTRIRNALKNLEQVGVDILNYRKDNSTFWNSLQISPLRDSKGNHSGFIGVQRDVTHQKRMEKELRASEERLRLALSSAKQGLYDLNVKTGVAVVSDEYATMLGYAPKTFEETIETWRARVHPDDRGKAWQTFQNYVSGRASEYRSEFRLAAATGEWRWILSQGGIVSRDAEGKPLRMLGTHTDVSELRRLADSLQESELRLQTLVSHLPGMAYRCRNDENRTFSYVSEGCQELTGYGRQELEGNRAFAYRELIHPEDRDWVLTEFAQALEEGVPSHNEYRISRRDGEVRWVSESASGDYDTDGKLISIKGLIQDVTDSQQRREDRLKMERRMYEAQKLESLGILAGGIAHDFNNILTGVLGNASQALTEIPSDSPIREYLEAISECSERAAGLSQQMLAYSGKGHFVVQKVDLSKLIQSTAQMIGASISKQAKLTLHLEPELPLVEADVTQLQQVVMNLVINASESLDGNGGGEIEVWTETVNLTDADLSAYSQNADLRAGEYVCLRVQDDGAGMTPEEQEKIFDPFFTTKQTGRGLGLAAVQGIVRGHKGALQVRSELGEGTTFQLLFPASPDPVEEEPAPQPPVKWRGEGSVLLVDDEDCVRKVIERSLRAMGFSVESAENGEEAQELFEQDPNRFKFALLDMTMPGKNGEETLRALRSLNPELKAIIMSGFSAEELTAPQDVTFLQKPMSMSALRDVIKNLLG